MREEQGDIESATPSSVRKGGLFRQVVSVAPKQLDLDKIDPRRCSLM